ncbi:hypothetical protein [Williamsia sp. DF01-3]|uniref:hypothetical protein n=1 Tax=Williamsia sp. DF01-3 TaxID=2934157 RepID=UPI001FF472B6|nr:hypothetical protein [Williamsia sp. DF01-3]MCK0515799.1 hypothetical protein [Williamsia sp. DF01-3]
MTHRRTHVRPQSRLSPAPRSRSSLPFEAGHDMDGMPLTDDDRAAIRRISRGESTGDQEVATLVAAIRARATP